MKTTILRVAVALCYLLLAYPAFTQEQTITKEKQLDTIPVEFSTMQVLAEGGDMEVESPLVIPDSPQSQLFERYINHAITEYSGLPEIAIPLYEIELNGLTIPIALTYHASGIQYMQHDGDVGVGWSINAAGYRVSRNIKGKSDFTSTLYDYNTYLSFLGETDKRYIDRYLEAMTKRFGNSSYGRLDGEYDMFTYMTPSTNGHFILTSRNLESQTYTAEALEQKMDNIEMNRFSGIVTDENGFQYYFGNENSAVSPGIVESTDISESMTSENTAWPLRTIQSPSGVSVTFNYDLNTYTNIRNRKDSKGNYFSAKYNSMNIAEAFDTQLTVLYAGDFLEGNYWNVEVNEDFPLYTTSPFLTRIISAKEEVEFVRIQRNGNLNSPSLISKIKVYDITHSGSKTLVREISFNYANMSSRTPIDTTTNAYPWHTVLTSIAVGDGTNVEKEYKFDYYAPPPGEQYASPDYWNYYVFGRGGGPDQDLFLPDPLADISFLRYTSGSSTDSETLRQNFGVNTSKYFIDRCIDTIGFKAFSLKRINFPTGGYTEYEYEPNETSDSKGNGQRVRRIKSYPSVNEDPVITIFEYGENQSGRGISDNTIDEGWFSQSMASYSVFRDDGIGDTRYVKRITTFTNTADYIPNESLTVYYPEVSTYQYNKDYTVSNGKTISSYNIPNNINMYGQAPGLKPTLSSRIVYNIQDIPLQKEGYTYQRTSGQTYMIVRPSQIVTITGTNDDPSYNTLRNQWLYTYYHVPQLYIPINYDISSSIDLLTSKQLILYTGSDSVVQTENYTYDISRNQLTKIVQNSSAGGTFEQEFIYPNDSHQLVTIWNIYSAKLQEITRNSGQELKRIRYNYPTFTGRQPLPLPSSIDYSGTGTGGFTRELDYLYDQSNGNLIQYTGRDGVPISYLWGYKGAYPVLEAVGDAYNNVANRLTQTELANIKNSIYTDSQLLDLLNNRIRAYYLSQAQLVGISSYSYKPLVGMTSSTDPNGIITRYEYDSFGRLKNVSNNDGKITARNYYHYYNNTSSDTPYLNTSPTKLILMSGASSSSLTISSNCTWSITDDASWLSVNTSSGTGNATITVSVTTNTSAARNAMITITYAGGLTKTVSVSQAAGSTSTLVVSPMTINFASIAPPQTVTITSNTSWTVTKSATWITISATSGTGNGTITVSGTKLLSGTRSGTVTFKTTDNTVTRIINVSLVSG